VTALSQSPRRLGALRGGVRPPARLGAAHLLVAAALVAGLVVGIETESKAPFGFGLAVGLCYVPVALMNLPIAVVVWMPLTFVDRLPLGGAPTAAGLLIVLSWFGAVATRGSVQRALLRMHRNTFALLFATLVWVTLSVAWAHDEGAAWQSLASWYTAGLVLIVVATTVWNERLARMAFWAVLVGGALSVVAGLVVHTAPPTDTVSGGAAAASLTPSRFGGASGDPNLLAAGLVPAMAVAAALALTARSRLWALALVVPVMLGFAATGSRGGLVALLVAVVVGLVVARGGRRKMLGAIAVGVVVAAVGFAANPALLHRVASFGSGGTGRSTLWTVGGRMWAAHPLAGVGIANYLSQAPGYVQRPGLLTFVSFISAQPKVAHNTYLQLLAETGLIGALLYLGTVFVCLRAAWRAVGLFERAGKPDMAWLARGALIAGLSMLAALFFISSATDKRLWAVLALGPVLYATGRRAAASAPPTRYAAAARAGPLPRQGSTAARGVRTGRSA